MADGSEHKTFILTTLFLVLFGLMLSQIPAMFYENQGAYDDNYRLVDVPSQFDTGSLEVNNISSQDYGNITHPTMFQEFYVTWKETNDTVLGVSWQGLGYGEISVYHQHQGFLGLWHRWVKMNPNAFRGGYLNSIEKNHTSSLYISCILGELPKVYCSFTYNTSECDTMLEAFNTGHLEIYLAFMTDATATQVNYSIWTLIGQILSFSSPNIHPLINGIIGAVVWVCILVSILYVWKAIKPFG